MQQENINAWNVCRSLEFLLHGDNRRELDDGVLNATHLLFSEKIYVLCSTTPLFLIQIPSSNENAVGGRGKKKPTCFMFSQFINHHCPVHEMHCIFYYIYKFVRDEKYFSSFNDLIMAGNS